MGRCGRAIGALHAHAVRDGVDFPALDGRLALGGADKSRDARLGCQRFVCVVVLVEVTCTYARHARCLECVNEPCGTTRGRARTAGVSSKAEAIEIKNIMLRERDVIEL
jgi:hypothetical protein